MILNDFTQPKLKFSREKLDAVLADLCGMVIEGQQDNPDFYGMVAAAVLDPQGRLVAGVNYLYGNSRIHAERAAIDKYEEEYGELPKGSIVITTLSPCCEDTHDNRYGVSCTDLLNEKHIKLAYCGYSDPSQDNTKEKFTIIITENSKIKLLCKKLADTFLNKDLHEETNKQILSYIKKIHPKGEFTIDHAVMNHAEWELTQVPLSSLHIDTDEVSPYDQINYIDYNHVADITAQDIKNKPIVVDNKGWIIDGNHRAVAARDMEMTSIPAYVPVELDDDQETYDQHMARIKQVNELFDRPVKHEPTNARTRQRFKTDVDGHEIQVHFNPKGDKLEVDFYVDGRGFALQNNVENPNKVFSAAVRTILDRLPDAIKHYKPNTIRYKAVGNDKSRVSLYTKLLRVFSQALGPEWKAKSFSNGGWQFYELTHLSKTNEDKDFNKCYATACKIYDKADADNLNPMLLQVAGYKGDGSTANTHWLEIPPRLWQHYVTVVGDMVLDPTAKQFGSDKATKYPRSQLDRDWDKQYQIKPKEVNENFADGKGPGRPGDSQRHGIRKGATMSELEKASHSKGRKGQLARWQLNMRRGKKK
jgi:pyrimidine deaminase RibD-like protein